MSPADILLFLQINYTAIDRNKTKYLKIDKIN